MVDRGEDMQQKTTGKIQTRVAAFRTGPIWYALYPVSQGQFIIKAVFFNSILDHHFHTLATPFSFFQPLNLYLT